MNNNFIMLILSLITIQVLMFFILENFIYYILNLLFIFVEIGMFLLILDNEYLAFLFIIIYGGAIIILFLFVLMLVDLKYSKIKYNFNNLFILSLFMFINFLIIYNLNFSVLLNIYFANDIYLNSSFGYIPYNKLNMLLTYDKFFVNDLMCQLLNLNDLSFLSYVFYEDYWIETVLIGYFILLCIIFITLFLIKK
jgi:NADH:ubiquinone oxidoreductase subunit 6 (subunit J)